MDENGVRALLERVAGADAPPSRVDLELARYRGRRSRHRRLALVPGASALAGATVVALLASGVLPWTGKVPAPATGSATSWRAITPPGTQWVSLAASSASDVWATGLYGKYHGTPVFVHFDGTAWRRVRLPDLIAHGLQFAVAATSRSNAWVVGSNTFAKPLIEHWNGTAWTWVRSASIPKPAHAYLSAVGVISARDVWAVGFLRPSPNSGGLVSLIEHWNGTAWTRVASAGGTSNDSLWAVAGTSAQNAWAIGSMAGPSHTLKPLIEHWNGTAWSRVPSPPTGDYSVLDGVTATSADSAWAVGSTAVGSTVQPRSPLIEHWNGSAWRRVPSQSAGSGELIAVSATSADDIWAVGGTGQLSGTGRNLILHWNGTSWTRIPIAGSTGGKLVGVAAISPRDAWAVSDTGTILHWDGSAWR